MGERWTHLETLLARLAPVLCQLKSRAQLRLSTRKPVHGFSMWLGLPYGPVVLG